jgi:hypothetical protein
MFAMAVSIVFVLIVLHLIRKKHLREQYSLWWLLFGLAMIVLSVGTSWLEWSARLFGVQYAPALLFLVGIIFCLILILHLTVVVSKLTERVVRLTQEAGLLRHELERLKREREEL